MLLRYLGRRALHGLVVLVVIVLIVFFIFYVLGDPTSQLLSDSATDEQREAFRQARGFADPVHVQLGRFVGEAATLQFGTSYTLGRPAMALVLDALPRTLVLAAAAFLIAGVVGATLGVLGGLREGSAFDRGVVLFSTFVSSIAEFWIGLLLIVIVSVQLGLLPTSGYGIGAPLVLPAVTLSFPTMGRLAFVVRTNVLNAVNASHVPPASARGLRRWMLVRRHVLRNASAPSLAVGGMELSRMTVGGAVVVESVFAWPGLGRLYVNAMQGFDLPVVSAALLVSALFVLLLNLLLDLAYAALDPRVTYS